MSTPLFREDAYRRSAPARVVQSGPDGIVLDASLFYPQGGGQPGDTGRISWDGAGCTVKDTRKGEGDAILLVPEEGAVLPDPGTEVMQEIDWDRRFGHMRIHTALHLLSVVLPLPVTGGQIGAEKGRLDFLMPTPPEDRNALEAALNALVAQDLAVTTDWIDEAELDANPGLVKTMSVQPPRGAGRIRLVRIGQGADQIDLQPCGGTHVARTGEIGALRLGKIENKGRENRRVHIHLA